jgi:plastocyanin
MKLDLTKLPVWEGIAGFLVLSLVVTFFFAYRIDNDNAAGDEPTASETPAGTPAPDGSTIAVSLVDNAFEPENILIAAGAGVTFDITNDGNAIHNLRVAGPDGSYNSDDDAVSDPDQVRGGDPATLEWEAPAEAGEIDFRCDFHPTVMTGTITVQ